MQINNSLVDPVMSFTKKRTILTQEYKNWTWRKGTEEIFGPIHLKKWKWMTKLEQNQYSEAKVGALKKEAKKVGKTP